MGGHDSQGAGRDARPGVRRPELLLWTRAGVRRALARARHQGSGDLGPHAEQAQQCRQGGVTVVQRDQGGVRGACSGA